jgi:hypothetical protein
MAYRFLGVKLLPGTHHLFLGMGRMFPGTPKLVLGIFWLLGTTPPFLGTLERFLGMPKIKVVPETPYRGLLILRIHNPGERAAETRFSQALIADHPPFLFHGTCRAFRAIYSSHLVWQLYRTT